MYKESKIQVDGSTSIKLVDAKMNSQNLLTELCSIEEGISSHARDTILDMLYHKQGCINDTESLTNSELACCELVQDLLTNEENELENEWLFSLQEPNLLEARDYFTEVSSNVLGKYGEAWTGQEDRSLIRTKIKSRMFCKDT